MLGNDINLFYTAFNMLKRLDNERLYIIKAFFCCKIMLLALQQYSYLMFFAHRGQRKSNIEREFPTTSDSMSSAEQFLSSAMRRETLFSDAMSCCALASACGWAGASVSSSRRSSGICRAYSRPRLDASMRSLTEK